MQRVTFFVLNEAVIGLRLLKAILDESFIHPSSQNDTTIANDSKTKFMTYQDFAAPDVSWIISAYVRRIFM